ncbi:MAG: ferrous iron transporter B [Lysobacterales bacterium]
MSSAVLRLALVGNPNCGKTALFNLLTGSRQKVANYAGVTVERRSGLFVDASGRLCEILDLPGSYSLHANSEDEAIARDAVLGGLRGERQPDLMLAVLDATHLHLGLRLVLELKALGRPMVVVLNCIDAARARGMVIDAVALSLELGCPVVSTVAISRGGAEQLLAALPAFSPTAQSLLKLTSQSIESLYQEVDRILARVLTDPGRYPHWQDRLDRVVMHPLLGVLLLATVMLLMFQAVFAWAAPLMDGLTAAVDGLAAATSALLAEGPLQSLLVDGLFAGVGSVLVFLPQILILFAFILALEDSGYLPRAAFLLDRLMRGMGLSGRAFIPLLSSFACAVPGIMATRTIADPRERLITIMVAPLMTCSARLPVYTLIIAAFIPRQTVLGVFNLQGLTLFALYLLGIASSILVAALLARWRKSRITYPLLLELPDYHWPHARSVLIGLWQRALIFLRRIGTIILALMVLLWFLSTWPAPPAGADGPAIHYSLAGMLGQAMLPLFAPIGFNWQMCIALVPGMAAREVAVSALGTVYALSSDGEALGGALTGIVQSQWGLASAFAFLAWYVYAPQCLSTLVTVRRETGSWRQALLLAGYLFVLAYVAAFLTYRVALWMGG